MILIRPLSLAVICTALIGTSVHAGLTSYDNSQMDDFDAIFNNPLDFASYFTSPSDPLMKEGFDFTVFLNNMAVGPGTVRDTSPVAPGNAGFKEVSIVDGNLHFRVNTVTVATIDFGLMNFIHSVGFMLEGHDNFDDYITVTAWTSGGDMLDLFQAASKDDPKFFGFHTDTGYITKLTITVTDENGEFNNKNGGFVTDLRIGGDGGIGEPNPVPEPATLLLLGLGAAIVPLARRFHGKNAA